MRVSYIIDLKTLDFLPASIKESDSSNRFEQLIINGFHMYLSVYHPCEYDAKASHIVMVLLKTYYKKVFYCYLYKSIFGEMIWLRF